MSKFLSQDTGKQLDEDGPYISTGKNGTQVWYLNNKRHREDGPAVEGADGTRVWYLNGKIHREDGPAYEHANGTKEWFRDGNRHREGGPAVERADGTKEWWRDGKPDIVDRSLSKDLAAKPPSVPCPQKPKGMGL